MNQNYFHYKMISSNISKCICRLFWVTIFFIENFLKNTVQKSCLVLFSWTQSRFVSSHELSVSSHPWYQAIKKILQYCTVFFYYSLQFYFASKVQVHLFSKPSLKFFQWNWSACKAWKVPKMSCGGSVRISLLGQKVSSINPLFFSLGSLQLQ